MRMAYEQAGWSPGDVDLIECHADRHSASATPSRSRASSRSGAEPAGRQRQCVIGSVKSNIGHALTAAGAAGLLKVLLALQEPTLPPTANFERSAPSLGLDESPFRVLTRAEPWPARAAGRTPSRAAVSGFGFGGINCHVLIEEWTRAARSRASYACRSPSRQADPESLQQAAGADRDRRPVGPFRAVSGEGSVRRAGAGI